MLKKTINTVVCDLGGVLINLDMPRCISAFTGIMEKDRVQHLLGTAACEDALEKLSIAGNSLMRDYEQGLISTGIFLSGVQALCKPGVTTEQISAAWFAMLSDLPQQRLDYILSLRQSGHTTCLLSNTNRMHWDYISARYALPDYFDHLFVSHEMHLSKPDKAIFEEVARTAHAEPFTTVYVDDLGKNRSAAEKAVGWRTCASISELQNYLSSTTTL